MHKRLAIITAFAVLLTMTIGLVGSNAVFTDQWTASQQMSIGSMTVAVSSDTPGVRIDRAARTISFPAIDIHSSSTPVVDDVPQVSFDQFSIKSTGAIPAHMSVTVTVTTSRGVEASKFALVRDGGSEGPQVIRALPVTDLTLHGPQTADISDSIGLLWTDLGNESMNGTVTLSLSFDATA